MATKPPPTCIIKCLKILSDCLRTPLCLIRLSIRVDRTRGMLGRKVKRLGLFPSLVLEN
jgi:hypothetical protein